VRISFPVFPGVRVSGRLGSRRQRQASGCAWLLLLMAIYIPIALAIKYWQWTLLIGSLVLLTVGMLKLIDRERRESREMDDLVARDVLRRRGRLSQTQLGHHQGSAAADREQRAMPASEVPATSDSAMQSPPGPWGTGW